MLQRFGVAILGLGLVLLAPSVAAQGSVIVVDDVLGPGVDFTTLAAAVAAASEYDTVVMPGGEDAGAWIYGKSLALTAAAGETVKLTSTLGIGSLGPNQFVSVAGITIVGGAPALSVGNVQGSVWIE